MQDNTTQTIVQLNSVGTQTEPLEHGLNNVSTQTSSPESATRSTTHGNGENTVPRNQRRSLMSRFRKKDSNRESFTFPTTVNTTAATHSTASGDHRSYDVSDIHPVTVIDCPRVGCQFKGEYGFKSKWDSDRHLTDYHTGKGSSSQSPSGDSRYGSRCYPDPECF